MILNLDTVLRVTRGIPSTWVRLLTDAFRPFRVPVGGYLRFAIRILHTNTMLRKAIIIILEEPEPHNVNIDGRVPASH